MVNQILRFYQFNFTLMKEILDEEFTNQGKESSIKLSENRVRKTVLYFAIMLAGGFAYQYYQLGGIFISVWWMLSQELSTIFWAMFISLVLEGFRYWIHRRKEKKAKKSIPRDPFWFQIIEGGFAIWILFSAVKLFSLFF